MTLPWQHMYTLTDDGGGGPGGGGGGGGGGAVVRPRVEGRDSDTS